VIKDERTLQYFITLRKEKIMFSKGLKAFSSTTLLVVLVAVMAWGSVASASEPFLAEIIMFGGNFAPRGWALCDGQLLAISQYSALFSLLGTTYGGDGRTTFGLPDMRGRVPMHAGNGPGLTPRNLGQKGGQERVTLSVGQMPSHMHSVNAQSENGNAEVPTGNYWAKKSRDDDYSTAPPDVTMNVNAISPAGGDQSHENMQPYTVVNFIIALQGVFPSRN